MRHLEKVLGLGPRSGDMCDQLEMQVQRCLWIQGLRVWGKREMCRDATTHCQEFNWLPVNEETGYRANHEAHLRGALRAELTIDVAGVHVNERTVLWAVSTVTRMPDQSQVATKLLQMSSRNCCAGKH